MSDKIDEEAILKFAGFEYIDYVENEAGTFWDCWWSGEEFYPKGGIYSLDWQAKYLWPKLGGIGREMVIGIAPIGVELPDAYNDSNLDSDPATAILLAVQELIKEKA